MSYKKRTLIGLVFILAHFNVHALILPDWYSQKFYDSLIRDGDSRAKEYLLLGIEDFNIESQKLALKEVLTNDTYSDDKELIKKSLKQLNLSVTKNPEIFYDLYYEVKKHNKHPLTDFDLEYHLIQLERKGVAQAYITHAKLYSEGYLVTLNKKKSDEILLAGINNGITQIYNHVENKAIDFLMRTGTIEIDASSPELLSGLEKHLKERWSSGDTSGAIILVHFLQQKETGKSIGDSILKQLISENDPTALMYLAFKNLDLSKKRFKQSCDCAKPKPELILQSANQLVELSLNGNTTAMLGLIKLHDWYIARESLDRVKMSKSTLNYHKVYRFFWLSRYLLHVSSLNFIPTNIESLVINSNLLDTNDTKQVLLALDAIRLQDEMDSKLHFIDKQYDISYRSFMYVEQEPFDW